jgi:hypothetical protein
MAIAGNLKIASAINATSTETEKTLQNNSKYTAQSIQALTQGFVIF